MDPSEPGHWDGPRPFVGREDVITQLRQALVGAMEESGRGVLLHGPPGSGRAALARILLPVARQGRVRVAIGDAADPDEPAWSQIAHQLTARRRVFRALGRTSAGWIGLIPVVGSVAGALVETVQALRRRASSGSEAAPHGTGSTVDQVRLLLAEAPMEPRLIILENLETGDPGEMAGAFALARKIGQTRTLFIGTSTSSAGKLPPNVALLLEEMIRSGTGDEVEIPPLAPAEVVEAVEQAVGESLPPAWRQWLELHAPPTPEGVWGLLGALVQRGVLVQGGAGSGTPRWDWARPPQPADDTLVAIREEETAHLSGVERRILAAAARSGVSFAVPDLADRLAMPEPELEEHLHRLTRRGHLAFEGTLEVDDQWIDRYRFPDDRAAARWAARQDPASGAPGP